MRSRDIITRLQATVPALDRRLDGAAALATLMRANAWPQASPYAFVLPLGLLARNGGDASANAFLQEVDETFGVLLFLRAAGDARGGKTIDPMDELAWKVIEALSGWATDDDLGVMALRRGALIPTAPDSGVLLYQLDFSIPQQVRLLS